MNQKGTPIYIGMSHNVRHRVRTHFNGSMKSARRQACLRDIPRIEAESTGSVLMARLIEDELIRTHWPIHNRAQKSIPIRTATHTQQSHAHSVSIDAPLQPASARTAPTGKHAAGSKGAGPAARMRQGT